MKTGHAPNQNERMSFAMATAKIAVAPHVVQFQQSTPRNFVEALTEGWSITTESSRLARGKRCGSVTLEKNGSRIAVVYFADRDGYRFGSPQAL